MQMNTPPTEKPFTMDWQPLMRKTPDWFRDAKFGLFFHWGPYSVPACLNEWYSRNMLPAGCSVIWFTLRAPKRSPFMARIFTQECPA